MTLKTKAIPFHKASIGDEEINEVIDTLKSGWLTMGPKTIEFEKRFSELVNVDFAISMNSATACLHLALKAIGLKKGMKSFYLQQHLYLPQKLLLILMQFQYCAM